MHVVQLAALAAVAIGLTGCVTPTAVKEASTHHGETLSELDQAVAGYRREINAYYQRVVTLQRDAYVAQHMTEIIRLTTADQADKHARLISGAEDDFIEAGTRIAEEFGYLAKNFDDWISLKGSTLDEKRRSRLTRAARLEERATALEGDDHRRALQAAGNDRSEAARSDHDLTYVSVAIDLERARAALDADLAVLAAQVSTMRAFHAKIDEFLSIDATIDGGKLAEAAAAGSRFDLSGLLGGK